MAGTSATLGVTALGRTLAGDLAERTNNAGLACSCCKRDLQYCTELLRVLCKEDIGCSARPWSVQQEAPLVTCISDTEAPQVRDNDIPPRGCVGDSDTTLTNHSTSTPLTHAVRAACTRAELGSHASLRPLEALALLRRQVLLVDELDHVREE